MTDCFSVPEAAKSLSLGVNTVYELCRSGGLPHLRIRGRIVIPKSQLAAWVNANTVNAVDPAPQPNPHGAAPARAA